MKSNFRKQFLKLFLYLGLGFILFFLFRLGYGYQSNNPNATYSSGYAWKQMTDIRRNYASKKFKVQKGQAGTTAPSAVSVDQKYEKVATINSKSGEYEKEEQTVRTKIKDYNGIIQVEKKSGNKGHRLLHLLVGIQPDQFENFYTDLLKIGKVLHKEISQTDKTNEYKELNAKKASLLSIRNSLLELKSKGGKIEEYIDLENRILEIEEQLQSLGVQLGNFDEENEFCTVRFSLVEGIEQPISLMHRVKVALEWTINFYLQLMIILFFIALFSFLALLIVEKLKILNKVVDKMS